MLGIIVFAPSIITFGYAMKAVPSYIATAGGWAVGIYATSALVGALVFHEPFTTRTAIGIAAACLSLMLLTTSG
jgi:multidrug transporter EmrE-like cation transporter